MWECQQAPPLFDRCHAPFRYDYPLPHLNSGLKFRGRLLHARLLAELLGDHLLEVHADLPQLILPVPLHPVRLRERGDNQTLEIARPLRRRFGVAVDLQGCIRGRAAVPQSSLPKAERGRNLRFGVCPALGPVPATT